MVCEALAGGGLCIAASLYPTSLGDGGIGTPCTTATGTCDSLFCGPFGGSATQSICTDSCQGPSSVTCPANMVCLTQSFIEEPATGPACTSDANCTVAAPTCFSAASGGDDRCHATLVYDICEASLGGTGVTGDACTTASACLHNLCLGGLCADPCCSAADCPTGFACVPAPFGDSAVMVCGPNPATGGAGAPCDPTAAGNLCRSGVCFSNDPYGPADAGTCTDFCCDDAQCGAGYYCRSVPNGLTTASGFSLESTICLKL